jgi:hypothetical protein
MMNLNSGLKAIAIAIVTIGVLIALAHGTNLIATLGIGAFAIVGIDLI